MRRRIICFFGAACMLLSLGLTAAGAERRGTVTVIPECAGAPVSGGTAELRKVGSAAAEGFRLTDGLANWTVKEEEGNSRSVLNWLAANTARGSIAEIAETGAVFAGVEEGIYLVMQPEPPEGCNAFPSFLVQMPEGENWNAVVRPKLTRYGDNPRTGDHPAPIIGAMGLGFCAVAVMVLVEEKRK